MGSPIAPIHLQTEYPLPDSLDAALLIRAAQAALERAGGGEAAELSVLVANDERLRQLNREYLGIDAPTDVLAFPAGDPDPDSGLRYLGDVVISLPRARSQAQAGGHALEDELRLLVVHGVLHLLGFDHDNPVAREQMWAVQAEILKSLGCVIATNP